MVNPFFRALDLSTQADYAEEPPEYPETVAWQWADASGQAPGRWSTTHLTLDGGKTTLCGIAIDERKYFDIGPYGVGRHCKRCGKARAAQVAAKAEGRAP